MKRIPNKKLSFEEYIALIESESFFKGGEGRIYKTDNPNTLYKFFIDPRTEQFIDISENKLRKIIALYSLNPEYMIKPVSTVSVNGTPVGYEMTYDVATIPFKDAMLSREEKLEFLTKTKTALQYLDSKDITYGDVKSNNILINYRTGQIEFCDIDNVRIGEYPIDLVVEYLRHFSSKYGKIDGVADAYMHNILTLQQLGFPNPQPTFKEVITTIEAGIYPKGFTQEAFLIFESMTNPENFNGEYAIQYVKK